MSFKHQDQVTLYDEAEGAYITGALFLPDVERIRFSSDFPRQIVSVREVREASGSFGAYTVILSDGTSKRAVGELVHTEELAHA